MTRTLRFSASAACSLGDGDGDGGKSAASAGSEHEDEGEGGDDDEEGAMRRLGGLEREEDVGFMHALGFEYDEIARRVREGSM